MAVAVIVREALAMLDLHLVCAHIPLDLSVTAIVVLKPGVQIIDHIPEQIRSAPLYLW